MKASFFDILGIDPNETDRIGVAATFWPDDLITLVRGFISSPLEQDGEEFETLMGHLNNGLEFSKIHPGVDSTALFESNATPGQIGFIAEMSISTPATVTPFYLRALPEIGIQLKVTDVSLPARVFFTEDHRGHELIIERLPVKLILPTTMAIPLDGSSVSVGSFDNTAVDSFAYTLNDYKPYPTLLECFIRLHITIAGDVIIEPTVPISLGPVRWFGLPAKAVYDIQFIPSPTRRDYLEWTHNDIRSFLSHPLADGVISFRSIELDFTRPPLSDFNQFIKDQTMAINLNRIEWVLENIALPTSIPKLPIPSHGTFGIRRKINDLNDVSNAFSMSSAPIKIPIYGSMRQGGIGGASLTLILEKFFFRTGDMQAKNPADLPQMQLEGALAFQPEAGTIQSPGKESTATLGPTFGIDDEWTLTAGITLGDKTPLKFTILDTTIGLAAFKGGCSLSRVAEGMPAGDCLLFLADIFISGKAEESAKPKMFKLTSVTGKPTSIILRDFGWNLGKFSFGESIQMPDGMQLIMANVFTLVINEMGLVEETNGTSYFSFSGGFQLPNGGIQVLRLRYRVTNDTHSYSLPMFKLDGIFIALDFSQVSIKGFGYVKDSKEGEWAINEMGFGVQFYLNLVAFTFFLSAMFIKGNRQHLNDSSQSFDYFLASLTLGYLPAGPIGLYNIRALVADNMRPELASEFPDGQGMALFKWYRDNPQGLYLSDNRSLASWIAEKYSFSVGIGCAASFNGCGSAMLIAVFIFAAKSKDDTGLLIVGELFLLKNPKPIAFVAVEFDSKKGKFGVMIGIDLGLGDFAGGSAPEWLAKIARLTGTLYFGNQPWTFAIGQIADQNTWLAFKLDFKVWKLAIKFMLGVCVQIVDGGPKAWGLVLTLTAEADWGVGSFILWATFGFIAGIWKTGSDTSGIQIWASMGLRINLFAVFNFGAQIDCRVTYLGKKPWYISLHAEIRIETPFLLPDVTFTLDKTYQEELPFDTSTISQGLSSAAAIDPTSQQAIQLVTPGLDSDKDTNFVYTFNELNGKTGKRLNSQELNQLSQEVLPLVSTDSTIAINFMQPLSNDSGLAIPTDKDAMDDLTESGVQKVQDLTLRYGLVSISVRRTPRFGATAGTWTSLLSDSESKFTIGGNTPQTISFVWDADSRADGKLSPKRLLINSSSPYSFISQSAQNDEEAVRNDPDFPCCDPNKHKTVARPHILEFSSLAFGSRTPSMGRFSGLDGAWWHWCTNIPPVVAAGDPLFPMEHIARVMPRTSLIIGYADLPQPAANAQIELGWERLPGILYFEAYSGVRLVGQKLANLHSGGKTTLVLSMGANTTVGITRLLLRVEMEKGSPTGHDYSLLAGVAIFRISYITLSDVILHLSHLQGCDAKPKIGPPGTDASGKLAFLPNHDYEITLTTKISVGSKNQGTRSFNLTEACYFRTKGLPGLNAAPNVGDDIRLHVDQSYPPVRSILLYRSEPCVLAFNNSLSSILPIDRMPKTDDPPEKKQMFRLELNIDRVVSANGMKRLTVPSLDWITENGGYNYPILYIPAGPIFANKAVRFGRTKDPLVLRHEAVLLVNPICGPTEIEHASEVLLHQPIDKDGKNTAWEAATGYRATVREENGPFTERSHFSLFDLNAFKFQADNGANASAWSIQDDCLLSPVVNGGRCYASCGELDWNYLKVQSLIDLQNADAAGIAVSVADGVPVPQALLALVEKTGAGYQLVIRARDESGEHQLGQVALSIQGPFTLAVTAYDDKLRASVDATSLEVPRGKLREGRVALVASGPALFAGISVNALDIFTFEFVTSKYHSFNEHLKSYDDKLPILTSGDLGNTPITINSILTSHGNAIAPLMTADSDPQERQKLFDTIIGKLGIGLRNNLENVSISRLNDANGTFGFLIQSPEAISLTRDVTIAMTRHVRVWVSDIPLPKIPILRRIPISIPGPDPVLTIGTSALTSLTKPTVVDAQPLTKAMPGLRFEKGQVKISTHLAKFSEGDRIVRVVAGSPENRIEIYNPPSGILNKGDVSGSISESLLASQAVKRSDLAPIATLSVGSIAVLPQDGNLIWIGHWEEQDVPVPLVFLSNGAETSLLLISQGGSVLLSGTYTFIATLERDRWHGTTANNPLQHYHDKATLTFHW